MTRHQRRKRAAAMRLVRDRQAIVRDNLSNPVARERSVGVSSVYDNRMDRARGKGVTSILSQTHTTRVIRREGRWQDCFR